MVLFFIELSTRKVEIAGRFWMPWHGYARP
jgi:hypothetical protein